MEYNRVDQVKKWTRFASIIKVLKNIENTPIFIEDIDKFRPIPFRAALSIYAKMNRYDKIKELLRSKGYEKISIDNLVERLKSIS